MWDVVAVVAGSALVVLVLLDALLTTLAAGAGAGPLTNLLTRSAWRASLAAHRRDHEGSRLRYAGTVLLLLTVLVWVLVLWLGWTLVLLGSGAVESSQTTQQAGVADVVYYAGFTLFTLGVGDFVATTPGWRVVTAAASYNGLFLVTLGITYLLSVVGAAVDRRAMAVRIHALGHSSEQIVARGWTGQSFSSAFVQQLVALSGDIATLAEKHLAYPVLHYFHSGGRDAAASLAIAHLDGAMLLLREGVDVDARPDDSATAPVRELIDRYLTTVGTSVVVNRSEAPRAPSLAPLAAAGLPVVDADRFAEAVAREHDRRRTLLQLVHNDGWSWSGSA